MYRRDPLCVKVSADLHHWLAIRVVLVDPLDDWRSVRINLVRVVRLAFVPDQLDSVVEPALCIVCKPALDIARVSDRK